VDGMKLREMDGEQVMAIAAERIDALVEVGQTIRFKTGFTGIVRSVTSEGTAKHQGYKTPSTANSPVALVEMLDGNARPMWQFALGRCWTWWGIGGTLNTVPHFANAAHAAKGKPRKSER
jgi:hypothetical protein